MSLASDYRRRPVTSRSRVDLLIEWLTKEHVHGLREEGLEPLEELLLDAYDGLQLVLHAELRERHRSVHSLHLTIHVGVLIFLV